MQNEKDKGEISTAEEKVIDYYRIKNEIKVLYYRLKKTKEHRDKAKENMEAKFSILSYDIKGVSLSETTTVSTFKTSPIEQDIERYYANAERVFYKLSLDVMVLEEEISKKELEIAEMEYVLHSLGDEEQKLLKLKYEDKKSNIYIACVMNISRSSIYNLKEKILVDIYGLLGY